MSAEAWPRGKALAVHIIQHACQDDGSQATRVAGDTIHPYLVADAKKLASKGADVVAVDQTDAAALRAALDGVYGVFYVTVTLEIAVLQAEYEQGELPTSQLAGTLHELASFHQWPWNSLKQDMLADCGNTECLCAALAKTRSAGRGPGSASMLHASWSRAHMTQQNHVRAGIAVADTAAAAGVKVFVFSTLENVAERTKAR